jgi:hypothetical protein
MALSADPKADPAAVTELGAVRQTMFMGSTLRGLLLYGYAFATMGTIALYAAVAAYIGSAVLLVLSLLGLRHSRKVVPARQTRAVPVPA